MFEFSSQELLLGLLGGVLPALFWLYFWLREDRLRPEPRGRLAFTFFLGMVSVLVVIPIEQFFHDWIGPVVTLPLIIIWSATEEVAKLGAAYFAGLRSRDMNEPIDAVIYLITAALGFSALENTLFILNPLGEGFLLEGFVVGNMRFIGATLLHTLASGIIGMTLAFSYYRARRIKKRYGITGIVLAIALHAVFNFFIISKTADKAIFAVFAFVWLAIIGLLLLFEKVKRLRPTYPIRKNRY